MQESGVYSYEEAINDPIHGRRWRDAKYNKLDNLATHHTWEYEELPLGRKSIASKWVFKVKYNFDGTIERFKARLIAQGLSHVSGIDFDKTFPLTVRRKSLRIFLVISAILGLIAHQVNMSELNFESL